MITSNQAPPAVVKVSDNKKRRKTILLILGIVVSVLVAATGIAFITMLAAGYGATDDSHKQAICTAKAIDFAQKGIVRDAGGFNGAIYECTNMNYRNSIYGDVLSAVEHKGVFI